VRPSVEITDDHTFHDHADQHDEKGARDHRHDKRVGVGKGEPPGIPAEHEHGAVREIEHPERAVDDRQARSHQRQKGAEHEAVEQLRYKIRPVDHSRTSRTAIVVFSRA
jgi:hypothetical protein